MNIFDIIDHILVALYIRVSTEEQAKAGFSLDGQEEALREYCRRMGFEVYKLYRDDGISAKNIKDRPGLVSMLEDAKKGLFNVIIVWKLNRLTRNVHDLSCIELLLNKQCIILQSCTEGFDSSTPSGRMIMYMLCTIAQYDLDSISENVKLGNQNRAKKGLRTCNHVLGYDIVGKNELKINPDESKWIKFIFEKYLEFKNLSTVARLCRENGFSGKRNAPPHPFGITKILSRPIYCGYNYYGGAVFKGNHEPIIDVDVFNNVQRLLLQQGRFSGRKRLHQLMYIKQLEDDK
jgi:site-specific DNA recombinase